MSNFTALQDHMVDGAVAEATAHCQTGVPGADNDCCDIAMVGHSQSGAAMGLRRVQSTTTVTFVGLVTMS